MTLKLSHVDWILTTGLVISISISTIMVVSGQDQNESMMIGLLVAIFTLLIDIVARVERSKRHLLEVFPFSARLCRNKLLELAVRDIVDSYLEIESIDNALFITRRDDALMECKEILGGLKHGYLIAEPGGKYAYGTKGVENAQESVKAVAYEEIELWRTPHLKSALEANAAAVKRGVRIQRVFILNRDSLTLSKDVLQKQAEFGVEVYVAFPEDLPSLGLLESYLVIDDKELAQFYLTRDVRLREERISIIPTDVDRAIRNFTSVLRRSHRLEDELESSPNHALERTRS